MTNKYFTPDIEDIRVGYECEMLNGYGEWKPFKFEKYLYYEGVGVDFGKMRVPYLTKEQIEAEGWEAAREKSPFTGEQYKFRKIIGEKETGVFNQDHIYTLEYYGQGTQNLKIHLEWESSCNKFNGYMFCGTCKDINTFRYICKLLNI